MAKKGKGNKDQKEPVQVFETRVQRAISAIRNVARHGGRNYKPGDKQVEVVNETLQEELNTAVARLEAAAKGADTKQVSEKFSF